MALARRRLSWLLFAVLCLLQAHALQAQMLVSSGTLSGMRLHSVATIPNDWWFDVTTGRLDLRPNGGSPKWSWLSDGSLGLGTTTPQTKLHMSTGALTIDGNQDLMIRVGTATFVVKSSGPAAVGIGTSAPGAILHVYGRTGQTYGAYDNVLRVEGRDYTYMEIKANPTNGQAGVLYNRGTTGWFTGLNNDGLFRIADLASINETGVTNAKDGYEGVNLTAAGNVGIGTTDVIAMLDIAGGADGNGANDPRAIALQYRTGGSGGYRHWIRSRHSSAIGSENAIDFYVNNGGSPEISVAPGNGSLHNLTLDSGNVGIGTTLPTAPLYVSTYNFNTIPSANSQAGAFINIRNYGGEQASLIFSTNATNTGASIRSDMGGNLVLNAGSGAYYFQQDFNTIVTPTIYTGASSKINFAGNVGLGTTAPTASLDVSTATGANPGFSVGTSSYAFVPSGAIMYFNKTACPNGWTELTGARGRYIVGTPASGTLGGTAGTALSNGEDRPTGTHSHPISNHSHTGSVNLASGSGGCGGIMRACGLWGASGSYVSATVNTTVTSNYAGTANTNAPYIQYIVCLKN